MTLPLRRPSRPGARNAATGAVAATVVAAGLALAPVHGPTPALADEPAAAVTILGPDTVTLLDVVQLWVDTSQVVGDARVAWDLDGDGTFETPDDGDGSVTTVAGTLGTHDYAVQVVTGAGVLVDDHEVAAGRPPTTRLQLSPAAPRRGQTLALATGARSDQPVATVWDVEGVQPRQTSAPVGRESPRRAASATAVDLQPVASVAGTGRDVTSGTAFTAHLPQGTGVVDRSLTLTSSSVFAGGSRLTTVRSVQVTASKAAGYATATIPPDTPYDCDDLPPNGPAAPCASLTHGDAKATFPTLFDDTTPSVQWCHPLGQQATAANTVVSEKAADIAGSPGFWGELTASDSRSARRTPPARPAVRTTRRADQVCTTAAPQTVSWSFGDGTGTFTPTSNAPVPHVYAEPGAYQVRLTTRVPYLRSTNGVLSSSPRWMTVIRKTTVTVVQGSQCGFAGLGGLRAYTMPAGLDPRLVAASSVASVSCWDTLRTTDGHTVFRTRPGWVVWLVASGRATGPNAANEQVVVAGKLGSLRQLVVDPTTRTITPLKGFVDASWGPPGELRPRVLSTPVLQVPPAVAGEFVFPALPGSLVTGQVGGLKVTSAQLVLREAAVPYVRLSLAAPPPLTGATPVAYRTQDPASTPAGVGAAAARLADYPPGVDFRVDVSGMTLAGVEVEQGWLEHYPEGDVWRAALVVEVAGTKLDAPFLPDPGTTQSEECSQAVGPSGVQITGGDFDFGGAAFTATNGPAIGPLTINCLAVNVRTAPFLFRGAAEGRLLNLPVGFNACFAFGVLDQGQKGNQCNGSYTAPEDGVVWVRVAGKVKLLGDYYTLRGAVEGAVGSTTDQLSVEGGVHWEVLTPPIDVVVDYGLKGAVRPSAGQFSLFGHVRGCINPAYIPTICGKAEGGITNRGGGVCLGPAGAVYLVDGGFDWFLISCDLQRDIAIAGLSRARRGAPQALDVEPGEQAAVFVASTDEPRTSPDVTLVSPTGQRIRAGEPGKTRGWTVLHNDDRGETYIRVVRPAAGRWRLTATTGSPTLSRVELYTPGPAPRVDGEVTGQGRTRTVRFEPRHLTGQDRITFVETSPAGPRVLGTRGATGGPVPVEASGVPGDRKVWAVVERRGIPFRRVLVDTYRAPGVPDLGRPADVRLTPSGADLGVRWDAVRGAEAYRVSVVLDDGRRLSTEVRGTRATFSDVTRVTGGTVRVVAVDGPTRDSAPASSALRPQRSVQVSL